jgi:RNA polymerase sigma-70 factor (ECF subfamily)
MLERAMARLPEHYRLAIRMRHEEGWSFERMAEVLGGSPEAARKIWARAIERLRDELGPTLP